MRFSSIVHIDLPRDITRSRLLRYYVIVPALCATCLSLFHLGVNSFWLDEVYSISFVSLNWSQLWEILSRAEANMSLYYVLLKVWVALGQSEFIVRSLSVVFAAGGIIVVYAIGVSLFNNRTGLTAAFLLSVNAYFIRYAQEARGYTLLLLLTAFSMLLFIHACKTQQFGQYIALGILNALVLYSHLFGIFAVFAQMVSLVFLPRRTIQWRKMMVSVIVTVSLASPLALFVVARAGYIGGGWIPETSLRAVTSLFFAFTSDSSVRFGRALLISYFVPCFVILAITLRSLFHFKRSELVWRRALLFCWLFVPMICVFLVSLVKPSFVVRYLFLSLPALVLLAAAGVSSLKSKALYAIATSLLIILSVGAVMFDYYPKAKVDWRSATRFVTENAREGDAILFYSQVAQLPFEYYYDRMNHGTEVIESIYPYPFGTPIGERRFAKVSEPNAAGLRTVAEKYDRLWVVLAYDKIEGMGWDSTRTIDRIEESYVIREERLFNGITVKLYECCLNHW